MEKIDPRILLTEIAAILEKFGIPYLITGGMAVFIWGRPRFTADIDIVVELAESSASVLTAALLQLSDAGYVDTETVRDAVRQKGEFNFIDGNTGMKVDFWISNGDTFDVSRFCRRVPRAILGKTVYFSAPEDLVLSKLHWYAKSRSTRHLEDIRSILAISDSQMDKDYLHRWIGTNGYGPLLKEAGIEI